MRCKLQEWLQELEDKKTADEKMRTVENILYVGKSVQDKALLKLAGKGKKYDAALKSARAEALNNLLRSLGHGSNSRVLSRDIGILTGWLLAKNKIAVK